MVMVMVLVVVVDAVVAMVVVVAIVVDVVVVVVAAALAMVAPTVALCGRRRRLPRKAWQEPAAWGRHDRKRAAAASAGAWGPDHNPKLPSSWELAKVSSHCTA